jgi:predicted nucleic acid-binding Zn ribbon protein
MVILVELVGYVELVVSEQCGERLVGRHQRRRHVPMVSAAVCIAGIVITAVGGEGGSIARDDQTDFCDRTIYLPDRGVARVRLDVPGVGLNDRATAALVVERPERDIAQPAREITADPKRI